MKCALKLERKRIVRAILTNSFNSWVWLFRVFTLSFLLDTRYFPLDNEMFLLNNFTSILYWCHDSLIIHVTGRWHSLRMLTFIGIWSESNNHWQIESLCTIPMTSTTIIRTLYRDSNLCCNLVQVRIYNEERIAGLICPLFTKHRFLYGWQIAKYYVKPIQEQQLFNKTPVRFIRLHLR